jgi:hypothetical protein
VISLLYERVLLGFQICFRIANISLTKFILTKQTMEIKVSVNPPHHIIVLHPELKSELSLNTRNRSLLARRIAEARDASFPTGVKLTESLDEVRDLENDSNAQHKPLSLLSSFCYIDSVQKQLLSYRRSRRIATRLKW